MKKAIILPILLLAATGCLSRLTQRLDSVNEQITQMNTKLDEANRLLGSVEKTTTKLGKALP